MDTGIKVARRRPAAYIGDSRIRSANERPLTVLMMVAMSTFHMEDRLTYITSVH
jgi:hypothetical protein